MKDKYTSPELDIIEFDTEDVITASGASSFDQPIELPTIHIG